MKAKCPVEERYNALEHGWMSYQREIAACHLRDGRYSVEEIAEFMKWWLTETHGTERETPNVYHPEYGIAAWKARKEDGHE